MGLVDLGAATDLTLTRTDDAAVVEVLRGDVANYRALFLHALSVAARLQEQLDASERERMELRDEISRYVRWVMFKTKKGKP